MKKGKTIQIRIEDEMEAWVARESIARGMSKAGFIRMLIREEKKRSRYR